MGALLFACSGINVYTVSNKALLPPVFVCPVNLQQLCLEQRRRCRRRLVSEIQATTINTQGLSLIQIGTTESFVMGEAWISILLAKRFKWEVTTSCKGDNTIVCLFIHFRSDRLTVS